MSLAGMRQGPSCSILQPQNRRQLWTWSLGPVVLAQRLQPCDPSPPFLPRWEIWLLGNLAALVKKEKREWEKIEITGGKAIVRTLRVYFTNLRCSVPSAEHARTDTPR